MQRNDDHLEEDHMLLSQRHSEPRDNGGEDVQELGCPIELMILMDQCIEALVDGLPDHLSSGHKLSIELVKDILQVVSLDSFFGVKQLEELLDELGRYIDLEGLHISRLIDDQLQEKLVDALQVRPRGVYFLVLLDSRL